MFMPVCGSIFLASGSLTVMVVALAADAQARARTADRENFIFYSKLEERRSYKFVMKEMSVLGWVRGENSSGGEVNKR